LLCDSEIIIRKCSQTNTRKNQEYYHLLATFGQQFKLKGTTVKRLIINADDFGLHPAVNSAVIKGHVSGCITSTSLMPCAAAFQEAVCLACENPSLGVGIHLTLVGERPVADPARVPSLVDAEGRFRTQYPQFLAQFLQGRVNLAQVRHELTAQLNKAIASGVKITHIDSHQHLHVLPGIIDIVLDIAAEYGVKALRIPAEPLTFTGGYPSAVGRILGRTGLTSLATMAKRKARRRGFKFPDHFYGMLAGGNMREEYLLNIINQLPPGSSEIMVHPGSDDTLLRATYGWPSNWQKELAAVTSTRVLAVLSEQQIEMISFKELVDG
jgi:hopanoid biosynthesis associated protein HpnK